MVCTSQFSSCLFFLFVTQQYQLTPRKKAFALAGVGKGVKGDSAYAKNLAMAIFGPELLMNSSYSGKIVTGGKKKLTKETIPRPKLPASGLKVLTGSFYFSFVYYNTKFV